MGTGPVRGMLGPPIQSNMRAKAQNFQRLQVVLIRARGEADPLAHVEAMTRFARAFGAGARRQARRRHRRHRQADAVDVEGVLLGGLAD